MIVDVALLAIGAAFLISGYRAGFLKTLFGLIGYLGGGILGFYFAFNNLTGLEHLGVTVFGSILAIILGAIVGKMIGEKIAQLLRATIIRGPLRWLDSLLGAALELIRFTIISYIVLALLMFSPWSTVRHAIESSRVFAKMEAQLPEIITDLRARFSDRELSKLRQYEPNELKKLQLN